MQRVLDGGRKTVAAYSCISIAWHVYKKEQQQSILHCFEPLLAPSQPFSLAVVRDLAEF